MTKRTFHSGTQRRFDAVAAYDRDAAPRRFDTLWSWAGVLFIAAATTVLVDEDWSPHLVTASEAAESTAPSGTLMPPRLNTAALTADFVMAPLGTDDIRHLQTRLQELGFSPGKIDGIAGARTLDALNAYRGSRLLEPVTAVDYDSAADLLN